MADACSGRNHTEVVERDLAPLEEGIAFNVALILAVNVHLERTRVAEFVDHDRVVDDQIDRVQRVDLFRIAAKADDRVAHSGEVYDRGHTGEVLQQNAGRAIGDFTRVLAAFGAPLGKSLDVIYGHGLAVFEAQHVFEYDLERGWQVCKITQSGVTGGRDGIIVDTLRADR